MYLSLWVSPGREVKLDVKVLTSGVWLIINAGTFVKELRSSIYSPYTSRRCQSISAVDLDIEVFFLSNHACRVCLTYIHGKLLI